MSHRCFVKRHKQHTQKYLLLTIFEVDVLFNKTIPPSRRLSCLKLKIRLLEQSVMHVPSEK